MKIQILFLFVGVMALPALSNAAAVLASDNASNSPYDPLWASGDNGGSLFAPWTITTSNGNSAENGVFIGTSNIDVAGDSFGMYANSGQTVAAVRAFTVGGANNSTVLGLGQTFGIAMDNGSINVGGTVGFGLQNSSGANRFEFYFKGGDNQYRVKVNGTEYGTGIAFTSSGLNISFEQDASNGYEFKVGASTFTQANFAGLTASDISQFRLFNANAGSGSGNDAFFNSFSLVPEPSRVLLMGFGLMGLVLRRRR